MATHVALISIIHDCTADVIACASYARRKTNAESIHQLRTAIRRLRGALSISRSVTCEPPTALVGGVRTLQRELGTAREWDVLIQDMIGTMPQRIVFQKGFGETVKAAKVRRTTEDERARHAFKDPRCTDLLLQLTAWTDRRLDIATDRAQNVAGGTIDDFAAQFLVARQRKVHKLAKKIQKLDAEGLHKLRIRIKKLRYTVEFFRDLWRGTRVKKYLAILKRVQDSLGTAHDAIVSARLIADLDPNFRRKDKPGKSLLDDWAAASLERERHQAARLLRKLKRLKPLT